MTIFVARGQNLAFPRSLPKVKYYFTPYEFIGHLNLNKVMKFDSCLTNTHRDILYLTCLGSRVTPFRVMRVKEESKEFHGPIDFVILPHPMCPSGLHFSAKHMTANFYKNISFVDERRYWPRIFSG